MITKISNTYSTEEIFVKVEPGATGPIQDRLIGLENGPFSQMTTVGLQESDFIVQLKELQNSGYLCDENLREQNTKAKG